ncbi:MAG TPA: cytochrome c [Anaerolineales bacterium]|nr:cytochrome c [Anaerolineales bacterium]HRQ93116.1 cytochrome c [Anaerolineales bacterium]
MSHRIAILLLLALALSACEFSLAGDVTPPPDAIISGADTTPVPVEYPPAPADPIAGAVLYAQSCAPCHGDNGRGDGAQANMLPVQPAPIGVSERADAATPGNWYLAITQGNLDNFMPPFVNQLSLQQRWDVLAYVYSLSQDPLAAEGGEQLYTEHQVALQAALPLVDIRQMAGFSRNDILAAIEPAVPSLSSAQLLALTSYLQAISLGTPPQEAPSAEDESTLASFRGQVQDGTDGDLGAGLQATLFGYDGQTLAYTDAVSVGANGRFAFDAVPLGEGRTFFASVDYLGLSYFSEFLTDGQTEFEHPITVYETTQDISQLAVERLSLILEFDTPGFVRVVQQYLVSNIGTQAVTPNADGTPVLLFDLPSEATELAFNEGLFGERYLPSEGGFGDLRAILPGMQSYQLLYAYQMPYTRSLELPLSFNMPARSVVVLVQDSDVSLQNTDFSEIGSQEIDGTTYTAYLSNQPYSVDEQPELQLRGRNPAGGGGLQAVLASDNVVIGLAALTVAVGLLWLWLRRMQAGPEQLLAQITRLDERFTRGDVAENVYKRQRAALKAQLRRSVKGK